MTIQLTRGATFTETNEQAILTSGGRNALYYRLNQVGTRILKLLLEGKSEESVSNCVAKEFGVEAERVRLDLDNLLARLRDARLIQI